MPVLLASESLPFILKCHLRETEGERENKVLPLRISKRGGWDSTLLGFQGVGVIE